jgi:hypothetical protein
MQQIRPEPVLLHDRIQQNGATLAAPDRPLSSIHRRVVDYRAPLAPCDELAMYDGSVTLERTKGEPHGT